VGVEDELLAIRLELKGQREAVEGLAAVDKAQKGVGSSTRKAGDEAKVAEGKTLGLGSAYGKLRDHAKLALGFIGVGGVFALEQAIQNTEELAKTTVGLSRNFGLQNNVASRWGAIAFARGIDSKALGQSFGTLSTKLTTAAREGGKALLPFHQLGISQEEAARGAHNFGWGIIRVAKALGEEEGGAKRSAAAKSLLGKGFATLLPLFSEGAEGLEKNLKLSDEYGVTLSGKASDGIMEMVESQRELKLAQLGIEVSMTKAFKPAIEAGEDQVKEFIKTLNDPNLSAEEKIEKIEGQFEGLEDDLIRVIEQALPGVAEHAGQLGVKIAGAVWTGFEHSDILGKLAIGGWLFNAFGGFSLVGRLGAKVGGKIATSLGLKFLETVAPYFAAEVGAEGLGSALASQMGGLKTVFAAEGAALGTAMGLAAGGALVAEIAFAIEDSENIAGLSLVNTPKADATSREEEATVLTGKGFMGIGFNQDGSISATGPGGRPFTFVDHKGHWVAKGHGGKGVVHKAATRLEELEQQNGHGRRRRNTSARAPELPRLDLGTFGSRPAPQIHHHQIILDGKVIAESTTRHAEDEAAFR
jgi:hypothetical protein